MSRSVLFAALLTLTMAGCAAVNPAGSAAPSESGFNTKLLNLLSQGSQAASQVNYIPNTQLNQGSQSLISNISAMFPIASAVGTGTGTAVNTAAQTLANTTTQTQAQTQLVL